MTPDDNPNRIAAKDLTDALNRMSDRLDKAEKQERRLLHRGWILFGAAVLLIALAAYGGQVAQCQSVNRSRAAQTRLWDRTLPFIIRTSGTPARQDSALDVFEGQVAGDFAPRACYLPFP